MHEPESFSNPLAPSGEELHDDRSLHPMTNEDFRKLMMTPRVPTGGASVPSSAATTAFAKPKLPEKEDESDPSSARKKKKSFYAQLKKEEEEREKELAKKYRDRARERRDGSNKDYDEQAELQSTTADYRAVAPDAKIGDDYAERRKVVIQESKYLGGDMEHTHLVKGLDYALLEKVKAEITSKEQEEEELENVLEQKTEKKDEEMVGEEQMNFRTKIGRNIYRQLFCRKLPERNELFLPGRMAYVVDLEDDFGESDIPTTLIRSKADCPSLESTTTLTNNDIVINKLTQILSYLRQGRRDRKKRKDRGKTKEDEKLQLGVDEPIYGTDAMMSSLNVKSDKRDKRDRSDQDRHDRKKSYFEKPAEDDERNTDVKLPTTAKDLVKSINERFSKSWGNTAGMIDTAEKSTSKPDKDNKVISRLKSRTEIDSYAECYPGMMESADAIDDSDDEVDYTKMDQGNKKGPIGRWDFDTQEEYSSYMSTKEALPKAAFQYGVKMADGRKTRRTGPKDEKKELDREWQKIQNIIAKRKTNDPGAGSAPSPKAARY